MKVYKLRAFARFQRHERIADQALLAAVREAESGLIEADLGGGLIKQRIARAGQGKRGGYRMIIAYRRGDRAVFLYGFAKNERGNIDDDEQVELRRLARGYLGLDDDEIEAAIAEDELLEVGHVEEG